MRSHGGAICGGAAAGLAYTLGDVEDDGCEAVLVEIDFLVVGNLPDRAGQVIFLCKMGGNRELT